MSMFEHGYLSLMCSFYSNCEALGYFSKHHKDGVRNLVKLLLLPLNCKNLTTSEICLVAAAKQAQKKWGRERG